MADTNWCRPVSGTSRFVSLNPSLEYMYCIYHPRGGMINYEFYRLNLNGGGVGGGGGGGGERNIWNMPPPFLRLNVFDFPCKVAFVALGSRIYLIGGSFLGLRNQYEFADAFSRNIYVVETQNIHTTEMNRIIRIIPLVLHSGMNYPRAVAIGGKIYIFPSDFSPYVDPPSVSRFQVFDPSTETCTLLPEPTFETPDRYQEVTCYFVLQNMLIISTRDRTFLFNTTFPYRGWKEFSIHTNSVPLNVINPAIPSATVLVVDDRKFCGLNRPSFYQELQIGPRDPTIVHFVALAEDSIQLGGRRRVLGLQKQWVSLLVPHSGNLICCYTRAEGDYFSSSSPVVVVPTFKQYSLVCHFDPQLQEEYYVAEEVRSFEYRWPSNSYPNLVASFVIPAYV